MREAAQKKKANRLIQAWIDDAAEDFASKTPQLDAARFIIEDAEFPSFLEEPPLPFTLSEAEVPELKLSCQPFLPGRQEVEGESVKGIRYSKMQRHFLSSKVVGAVRLHRSAAESIGIVPVPVEEEQKEAQEERRASLSEFACLPVASPLAFLEVTPDLLLFSLQPLSALRSITSITSRMPRH